MTTPNESAEPGHNALGPDGRRALTWLRERESLLILTHERPDGDAFGCVYAAAVMLEAAGKSVVARIDTPLPRRYTRIFPSCPTVSSDSEAPFSDKIDGVLCLDTSSATRATPEEGLRAAPVCNIDHHRDNARFGAAQWIDPEAGATAEMLTKLFDAAGWLTPAGADCLLTGIMTDTGGLRFPNTTPATLRSAARLCEAGAQYARLTDALFFREPLERRRLEAHLIESATPHFGGRLMVATLPPEEIERRGLTPAELEGLIDVLRGIDGVDVACLIQPGKETVRISMRARSSATPVDEMAHQLGGGGHPLAAGVRMDDTTEEEAIEQILEQAEKALNRP